MSAVDLRDFKVLFESIPDLYLVLDRDLRIAAASDGYLRATCTCREGMVGRHVSEVFRDNGRLRASFERVLRDGVPDVVELPRQELAARHWKATNTPIEGPDGRPAWI